MEITIHKEIVNVYIRWKEDNIKTSWRSCGLHKIRGINIDKDFLHEDAVDERDITVGWLSANLEVGNLYMLNFGPQENYENYFVVLKNRGQLIMSKSEAVAYFIDNLAGKDNV